MLPFGRDARPVARGPAVPLLADGEAAAIVEAYREGGILRLVLTQDDADLLSDSSGVSAGLVRRRPFCRMPPAAPMERMLPALPMDRMLPALPMDSRLPELPIDRKLPRLATLAKLNTLSRLSALSGLFQLTMLRRLHLRAGERFHLVHLGVGQRFQLSSRARFQLSSRTRFAPARGRSSSSTKARSGQARDPDDAGHVVACPDNGTVSIDTTVREQLDRLDVPYEIFACDPALADTANFCAAYSFDPEDSANTILVIGKSDPPVYAACVVLAITGMEIGGVTVFGLPPDLPIWIDARVMGRERIVLGGGSRSFKVIAEPGILLKLPRAEVIESLAN